MLPMLELDGLTNGVTEVNSTRDVGVIVKAGAEVQVKRLRNYSFERCDLPGNRNDSKPAGPGKDKRELSFAARIVRNLLKLQCVA